MPAGYELVDRPALLKNGRTPLPLTAALLATVGTAQAIRFNVSETERRRVLSTLRTTCHRRYLTSHLQRQSDGSYIAWAESREEPSAPSL